MWDLLNKYKDETVYFHDYYKYTFTYCCNLKSAGVLYCTFGGDPDEIYRMQLGSQERLGDLEPDSVWVEE